jgi:CheY-like chemotaxis protein
LSSAADLLRAIADVTWVAVAFVVVVAIRGLLKAQRAPLTKFGLGPTGVTMEFAEAKLTEAVAKSDDETKVVVGDAAKRSVLDRLQRNADLLRQARILWVDDHPENNTPLTELLRRFGATVDTPRSNKEALGLLSASRYHVVISDVARDDEGPDGSLKGVELARAVFDGWRQRVLLFTARFDPARLPGASEERRLELVSEVQRTVFARTNRSDEALHYILDLLER